MILEEKLAKFENSNKTNEHDCRSIKKNEKILKSFHRTISTRLVHDKDDQYIVSKDRNDFLRKMKNDNKLYNQKIKGNRVSANFQPKKQKATGNIILGNPEINSRSMSTKSLLSQELLNNKSALKSILVNNENRLAKSPSICVEDYSSIRNNTCREIKKKKRKPAKCGVIKFNGQSGFLNGQKMFDYKNYLKI